MVKNYIKRLFQRVILRIQIHISLIFPNKNLVDLLFPFSNCLFLNIVAYVAAYVGDIQFLY